MSTPIKNRIGVEVCVWLPKDERGNYVNALNGAIKDYKDNGSRVGHAALKIYPSYPDQKTYSSLMSGKDHIYVSLWPEGFHATHEIDLKEEKERPNAIIRLNNLNISNMLGELNKVINTANWVLVSTIITPLSGAHSCASFVHKLLEIGGLYTSAVYRNVASYEGPKNKDFYVQTNSHLGDISGGSFNSLWWRGLAVSPKLVLHLAASAAEADALDKQDTLLLMNSDNIHKAQPTPHQATFEGPPMPKLALAPVGNSLEPPSPLPAPYLEQKLPPIDYLKKSSLNGDPISMNKLAACYYHGVGVPRDFAEAIKLYRKAAEKKVPEAIAQLGHCYNFGYGVPKDEGEAFKWYQIFIDGKMTTGSPHTCAVAPHAYYYYWRAAQAGNAAAQYRVASHCHAGYLSGSDPTAAFYWFKKAAEQDHIEAQFNLAKYYHEGRGTGKDLKAALTWYKKAADNGHAESKKLEASLSQEQETKMELDKRKQEAATAAPSSSPVENEFQLYQRYRHRSDTFAQAFQHLQNAAQQGHALAQYELARHLYNGGGPITKSPKDSFNWAMNSATQGNVDAQFWVAMAYKFGRGTTVNLGEARSWFSKAAQQGNVNAKNELAALKNP